MPSMCFYVSGRERVSLDGPGVYVGTADQLRGREWSYALAPRGLSGVLRSAREVEVSAAFPDAAAADLLRRVADRDVENGSPGTIEVGGEWSQRAYIVKCEPRGIFGGFHAAALAVVLLDGSWRRRHVETFWKPAPASGGGWLDLPHDLPCDLAAPRPSAFVGGSPWRASPVRLVVYGPATNPTVTVCGNRYQVDVTVPSGGYLVVDGVPVGALKSVVLHDANGDVTDEFAKAHRGTGAGGGEYAFQPLPPGGGEVSWDGSFAFDLEWYEEEGEPPWAS